MNAVLIGIAIMVGGAAVLYVGKAVGKWLAAAIAKDIHDGIGNVVREQLESLNLKVDAIDARDIRGHAEVIHRLDQVEAQNTADHGAVVARLSAVEARLAAVESRLPESATTVQVEVTDQRGAA